MQFNFLPLLLSNRVEPRSTSYILLQDKSGKSPLQLLAQTCSQIGADPGNNKMLQEKSSGSSSSSGSANSGGGSSNKDDTKPSSRSGKSPALVVTDPKPVSFKPYETKDDKNKTPSVVSLSPNASPKTNGKSPSSSPSTTAATSTVSTSSSAETTPVIRSGMEVLAGHPKDVPLGTYRPGLDNPAFRSPFMYPPTTTASAVCRDPFCRDPNCPTAVYNAHLASLSGLPPGYAELLKAHQMASGLMPPPTSLASSVAGGPYICNWMNGREGYCGKRHSSAEELLQHLRTHTNLSTSDSAAALSSLYGPGMLGSSGTAAAAMAAGLHRTYGSALGGSLSSRFHPYAKPGGLGSALPPSFGMGLPPAGLGGLPPSLLSAYSPSTLYSLYGSRLAP